MHKLSGNNEQVILLVFSLFSTWFIVFSILSSQPISEMWYHIIEHPMWDDANQNKKNSKRLPMLIMNEKQAKEEKEKKEKQYMSDSNHRAQGQLTKGKGFSLLSHHDELQIVIKSVQELINTINKKANFTIQITKNIIKKYRQKPQPKIAESYLPSSIDYTYKTVLSWDANGRPQIPTYYFKYSDYFRNMGHLIKQSWYLPGGRPNPVYGDDYHKYLYSSHPGSLRLQKYPKQEIVVDFSIDKEGQVTTLKIIKSNGYRHLEQSIIDAIQIASPFKPPPQKLLKKDSMSLKWLFKIYTN